MKVVWLWKWEESLLCGIASLSCWGGLREGAAQPHGAASATIVGCASPPRPLASALWDVSLSWQRFHRMCPNPPHAVIAVSVVAYCFLGIYFLLWKDPI